MDETQTPINSPNIIPTSSIIPTIPSKSPLALIIKIIAGVVGLIIVSGGVSLAARIWDPLWNPFRPEPEKVIEKMLIKGKEVKTGHTEIKIGIEVTDEKLEKKMQMSMIFSGDADITDPENPKTSIDFDITIPVAGLKESFSLAGESREIGDTFYLKMTKIDIPFNFQPFLIMLGIDKNEIQGQWIKLDKETLERLKGGTGKPEISKAEQLKLIEKSLELFQEKKVYYVKEELPDQKIKGKKVYHYLLSIDRENLKEVIPELLKIWAETSEEDGFQTAFIEGAMAGVVDEFLEKIEGIDFEVWIGKKDLLLYKVKIDKEINVSKFRKGPEGKITISFNLESSDHNKPLEIKEPKDFINLKEIIPPMLFAPPLRRPLETTPSIQSIMKKDTSSLFQASILEIFLNMLK